MAQSGGKGKWRKRRRTSHITTGRTRWEISSIWRLANLATGECETKLQMKGRSAEQNLSLCSMWRFSNIVRLCWSSCHPGNVNVALLILVIQQDKICHLTDFIRSEFKEIFGWVLSRSHILIYSNSKKFLIYKKALEKYWIWSILGSEYTCNLTKKP